LNADELLAHLDAQGVTLSEDRGKLRVSAPRGRLSDDTRSAIAAHKEELIALLARRRDVQRAVLPGMSLFQERLWLLQKLDPGSTTYLIAALWALPATTTPEAASRAIVALQNRHDLLRNRYPLRDGAPDVRLAEAVPPTIIDLSQMPDAEARAQLELTQHRALHAPINLEEEPAVQFTVFRFSDARCAVLLRAHHVAVDARSIALLRSQLEDELSGLGRPATRVPQYADFAARQRQLLSSPERMRDVEWWAERLRGLPQVCAFPPDGIHSPEAGRGSEGGRNVDFSWDPTTSARAIVLARDHGITLYMLFVSALCILLRTHTGQGDVVVGSPIGDRERSEYEDVVGPFVNLLLLRVNLDDDPSFAEAVRRVREAFLDAHARRHVPFEAILDRLKPARSVRHSPLFQVAVVQQDHAAVEAMTLRSGGAMHEMTWFIRDAGGRVEGSVEYRTDYYLPQTITRLIEQVECLIADAVDDPAKAISRLNLLSPSSRRGIVEGFNATTTELDPRPFHRQFEQRVAQSPGRIAISHGDESLTYLELNRQANRLARLLRGAGAGRGVRIAVCLERSLNLVVALVAVQKSGAAYVPLDPGLPAERLSFMLADSGCSIIICDSDATSAAAAQSHMTCIDPSRDHLRIGSLDASDIQEGAAPQDPAYVIYTSGSTGQPKGVVVQHSALSNFLGAMQREPGIREQDVLAAVTTVSFDIAALELYLPLCVGARIVMVDRGTASDGEALARALRDHAISVLQATPATWRMLLQAAWQPANRICALCGGEPLPRDLADSLLPRVGSLWNMYGPTETTIWSTVSRVESSTRPISIGRPIANTRVYVVGPHGAPVPIGVPGELWIGGAGVADGYHDRPDLTADRFGADPFAVASGARLYRTGDLARWSADGQLYHLGRMDYQVKIRGFRIELGEIESVLAEHPAIRHAIVVAHAAGSEEDRRLVAYLSFREGDELTTSDVRRHLRRRLPEYMIPSLVVALDEVPLTPNGKVDRKALRNPFGEGAPVSSMREPPSPGLEQALADIWCDVLQAKQVGASDNFFDLGGHSLLTLRVVQAFEARTGRRIDPRQLFFQTLRQVIDVVEGRRDSADSH
jgi:amino acid adenylation domain-containing protein